MAWNHKLTNSVRFNGGGFLYLLQSGGEFGERGGETADGLVSLLQLSPQTLHLSIHLLEEPLTHGTREEEERGGGGGGFVR